jgi:hypothetical protein
MYPTEAFRGMPWLRARDHQEKVMTWYWTLQNAFSESEMVMCVFCFVLSFLLMSLWCDDFYW